MENSEESYASGFAYFTTESIFIYFSKVLWKENIYIIIHLKVLSCYLRWIINVG